MGILYRAKQFFQSITAGSLSSAAQNQIESLLDPQEVELFNCYSHSDRRHAYCVLRTLQLSEHKQIDLLKAALLHDIGKTRVHLSVWERSIAVIGMKFFPQKATRWGAGKEDNWQRPFVVKARHAAWGAEMVAAAGSSTRTVNLIRRHQDIIPQRPINEEDKLLILLQWADNQN
ncbi:MAG: HD domain-containing protein [Anaerolineales bacterium]|nr:HD domain-containing protein [Anaerolineales bacterium]